MGLKKLLTQSIIWRCTYFFSVLLVNIFLARFLQAAGTGNLFFITVLFSFVQVALSLGGESGFIFFASGNTIERNKLTTVSIVWSFIAGIIAIGSVYVFFAFNHSANNEEIKWYSAFAFLYVCGQMLTNFCVGIYYSRENYLLPNLILAFVNFAFVVFIALQNSKPTAIEIQWVTFFYFATFFMGGLLVYISYTLQYNHEGAMGFPDRSSFIKLLHYSITALGANVVFFLVYKIDYLFVNYSPVSTATDLGNYIQASKMGQLMLLIPQIIASVVFPRTASGIEAASLSNAIMIIARLLSQLFLVVFIGVALMGSWFFTTVFGASFNEMEIPMLLLIPGIFSLSILALLSAYFAGKGKVKINLYGAIIGLVVMIVGDFIFVPRYGIIAAALISTLSYAANVSYSMYNFYRDYSVRWVEFFKWKKTDYAALLSLLKFNKASS